MASEVLIKICKKVSTDVVELYLLENILHLVYDSEINVKCCGIRLFFDVIPLLSQCLLKNKKIEFVKYLLVNILSSTPLYKVYIYRINE